ncbi:transportin-3 isoform X2 [Drosophila rhopaloa]|nr:transportin-3 isoform X2 [Drosophila rhopaloa]
MLEHSLVRKDLDSRLFEMVISLEPAFQRSVGNQQLLQNYCHIFVNLFETHFQLTKRNPAKIQERFLTIELLLLIAVHCPLSVIESSMDMWSLLSADLDYKADPEMTSSYRPYFLRLLKILFTITRVPESCEDMALPGPMDRFRGLVAEVLVDVAHLVELDTMQELYDIVEHEQSAWTDVEMAMFFLLNLMRNFKRHQEQLILSILESVKDRRQPLIRLQILELISTPGVVDPGTIFNCLLKELRQEVPMLARIVCRLSLLMPHWSYLLTLALSVDEFRLKESDRSDLLESVCSLVRQLGPSCVLEANKYLVNERRNCEGSGTRQNRIHMIQIHLSFERDT